MIDESAAGYMAWNAGLVTVAGFLVKRWMGGIEAQMKESCDRQKEEEKNLYTKIDGIHTQLKIANSRTSKNEEQIHVQAALCAERTRRGSISCTINAGTNDMEG